ncbi:MAG: YhfC family glutamic-type intramembrane protease [Polyangiales bacterium]
MPTNAALVAAFTAEVLIIIALVVVLLMTLRRRTHVGYRVAVLGAATFIGSQVVHIPLNLLLGPLLARADRVWLTAATLGLSAGLCEELARYAMLRTAARDVRDSDAALMFGAGHGGVEALVVALMAALALVNLVLLGDDPARFLRDLTPEQRVTALQGIEQMQAMPPYLPLVGALERAMVLPIHLAATLLVTLSVVRRQRRFLMAAIVLHAALDGVTLWLLPRAGGAAAELYIGVVAVVSLGLLVWLERALRVTGPRVAERPEGTGAPVELLGAGKRYGADVRALSNAQLTLAPGSRTCLLGPNGAGKTTAIRMLIGAIGATEGHALLFGRESGDEDFLVAKRRLGVVPQLPGMYPDLTVRDWLELVRDLYGAGDVDAVAGELGLAALLERPMDQLSGGQKRRVAIAAAVVARPELLILDEPSAGLDPIASREVLDYLGALAHTHTILLCTHDLVEAERLCDRVVVMLDGRVLVHEAIETLRARIAPTLSLRILGELHADAAAELTSQGFAWERGEEPGWVSVPVTAPERDAPRVLRALLTNGTDVFECRVVRPTLEDLFLDIVRADEATRRVADHAAERVQPGEHAQPSSGVGAETAEAADAVDAVAAIAAATRPAADGPHAGREPLPPPVPLRDLLGATTKRLMVKEWRQLRNSGAAFWTSALLPIFLLLLVPQGLIAAVLQPSGTRDDQTTVDFGLIGELTQDPRRAAVAFIPVFMAVAALIAPMSLITHAVIQEREARTLELLVALPVRIQQVIVAKLGTAFGFSLAICGTCALVLCGELLTLGLATVFDVLALLSLLVATLAYATAGSLLVALLCKDFRTANNLAGAVVGPAILVVVFGTIFAPGGAARPLTFALVFALGALLIGRASLRSATFERLLD